MKVPVLERVMKGQNQQESYSPRNQFNHGVWFREDLRIEDQLALSFADSASQVFGIFLMTPNFWKKHSLGPNKINLLLSRVAVLEQELAQIGIPLTIMVCDDENFYRDCAHKILAWAREFKISTVFANHQYEVDEIKRDECVKTVLSENKIDFKLFDDQLLYPARFLRTSQGTPFTVFTPFKNKALELKSYQILKPPKLKNRPKIDPNKDNFNLINSYLEEYRPLSSTPSWAISTSETEKVLNKFVNHSLHDYKKNRDFPDLLGTSKLSIPLSIGAISIRKIWRLVYEQRESDGQKTYLSELLWREFYKNILIDFPKVCKNETFKQSYQHLPWLDDDRAFEAWCHGKTGYPIVDAGMIQLREEGWMHNRVRMITAMFLTKNLLIDWHLGEKEFSYWLFDHDFSSNNGGWQWSASTGTDAAPYFRVFNPWLQTAKFDPNGNYIKKYIPQLAHMSATSFHDPKLFARDKPKTYPDFIVDYEYSRERCQNFFKNHLSNEK